ncbi:MAG TPA: RNase adapter RapZ [Thermoanaerobaculia bacterium]|nr:RNase adapter RapZ [Thermoanaerobaculia bacterium]
MPVPRIVAADTAPTEAATRRPIRLALITGLSGSGKSSVAKCFEDLGYYCMDNLPLSLLRPLLRKPQEHLGGRDRVAVVTDVRAPGFAQELPALLREVDETSIEATLLFLEASDESLMRRFSETRRRHPLTLEVGTSLHEAIVEERRLLAHLRGAADMIFDTSEWSIHEIRRQVWERFSEDAPERPLLVVSINSFGFKHGIPYATDLLFDVRFLENPYFVPDLRALTGRDARVVQYLESGTEFNELVGRIEDLLLFLLPRYRDEKRSYLTVAVGCTGGRHRSVAVCERLAHRLGAEGWAVRVDHRDLDKEE